MRVDLGTGTCNALVGDEEVAARKAQAPPPIPDSHTPWEGLYREKTGNLADGAVLGMALRYRHIARRTPRHNH